MLKLVDAERAVRRLIRDVSDGPSAQRALPGLEAGSRQIIDVVGEFRQAVERAADDVPLMQIHADYEQQIHELGKEFPDSILKKMDNPDVVQVWGDSKPMRDMLAAMQAYRQVIHARSTAGDSGYAAHQEMVERARSRFEQRQPSLPPADLTPPVPPMPAEAHRFPVPGASSGSPPDPNQRQQLDGPPRKNVVVVVRGPTGEWLPVLVQDVLPDGRVEVLMMNRLNGKLVPGERRTVKSDDLRQAVPRLDLSGT